MHAAKSIRELAAGCCDMSCVHLWYRCLYRSRSAVSALEHLLKPTQYKTLSGLKQEENLGNTW